MYVLGISAYYHNAAAALVKDGRVVCAAEEERFTRIKFDAAFPANAIQFCLAKEGISLAGISAIIYYEKPLLKFERIVDNFYQTGIGGYRAFVKYMPLWAKQKLFMRAELNKQFKQFSKQIPPIYFSNHHLSHAASAYYCSGFDNTAIITADGVGEWATATIAKGNNGEITTIAQLDYPHSIGLFYSAFTQFLGFEVNSGEYKLMGLAPYAINETDTINKYIQSIKKELIVLYADGSIKLNLGYFKFPQGFTTIDIKKVEKLLGINARKLNEPITLQHAALAMAVQKITEEVMLNMARKAKELTGSANLCLAGGVALNCVANSKILQQGLYDNIFIQPAAGDAGGALGAALAYASAELRAESREEVKSPSLREYPKGEGVLSPSLRGWPRVSVDGGGFNPFLGPAYSNAEIEQALKAIGLSYTQYPNHTELNTAIAKLLSAGKIVARFAGAMEWGPRALGNRSILANPMDATVWQRLNEKIKQRENFRPFAPAVLAEDAALYFEGVAPSPYMLYTFQLKEEWRLPVESATGIEAQLLQPRSKFPAITHADYSARVQTVDDKHTPGFYQLLQAFKAETGHGMLLNTSFNRNNEPIVNTPKEAIDCFVAAGLDALAIGSYLVVCSQ